MLVRKSLSIILLLFATGTLAGCDSGDASTATLSQQIEGQWKLVEYRGNPATTEAYLVIEESVIQRVWFASDNPQCWSFNNYYPIRRVSEDTLYVEKEGAFIVDFNNGDMILSGAEAYTEDFGGGDLGDDTLKYSSSDRSLSELSPRCTEV